MELPNIGQNCAAQNCKQLDFLPLTCKCGLIFCSSHFNDHCLTCSEVQIQKEANLEGSKCDYVCSHPSCKNKSYVPLLCSKCNKHFCIQHRHITECESQLLEVMAEKLEKFNAPVRDFNEAKLEVDKMLDKNIIEAKKKPKTQQMANKLQLMRIKAKAIGLKSVPVSDRAYFNVEHHKGNDITCCPIFVSKTWTLGRAIDAIAEECKVPNKNNQLAAQKLRLFHKSSGDILSTNLTSQIQLLLTEQSVLDGEDLILEYVDDSCTKLSQ